MNILKASVSAILGTLAVNNFIEKEMNTPDMTTYEPIDTVSIIVPSYNEEQFIKRAVLSIKNQTIIQEYPDYFEIILADSSSTDNTVPIAEPFVDRVINTPRGKLTARNLAILQSKGNIIVSVDADTFYPPFWLNTLLRPFNDLTYDDPSNIIGVVGSTYDNSIPMIPAPVRNVIELFERFLLHPNQMVGRNSTFYKHTFYLADIFDDINTNQFNVSSMVKEEEVGFGERLSSLGTIVTKFNANCIHLGGQKIGCRNGTAAKASCKQYGFNIERFDGAN